MFINIDLGQAENRIVAYVSGAERMIECFEKGVDVHKRTASAIFMKPEEQISDLPGSASDIGNGEESERFWGKKANHGFNYNLKPFEFARQLEIPEQDAKIIYNGYHNMYPEIKNFYYSYIDRCLEESREVINLFGRKFFFTGDLRNQNTYNQAYSFIPQSTVADKINRHGLIYIFYSGQFEEFEILDQVHDSIKLQVRVTDSNYEKIARKIHLIREYLEQPLVWRNKKFSIPADLSLGYNGAKFSQKNCFGLREIKYEEVEELARKLHGIYREYRAS